MSLHMGRIPEAVRARLRTEEEFHDAWARGIDVDEILIHAAFEAVTAVENRYALEELGDVRGRTVLDLGCGAGEAAVYFALRGARVTAVDLSTEMVSVARRLAVKYGAEVSVSRMAAEDLQFPDRTFDLVFGNGVLHHVEIPMAVREVQRILKDHGRAVFVEPLAYNPLIYVYRWMASEVRTPTERPFSFRHLRLMRSLFSSVRHREFWFFTLLIFAYFYLVEGAHPSRERYWKKIIAESHRYERLFARLHRLDEWTLRVFPFLSRLCWNTVLVLRK